MQERCNILLLHPILSVFKSQDATILQNCVTAFAPRVSTFALQIETNTKHLKETANDHKQTD